MIVTERDHSRVGVEAAERPKLNGCAGTDRQSAVQLVHHLECLWYATDASSYTGCAGNREGWEVGKGVVG
jgi:hypothetical protein